MAGGFMGIVIRFTALLLRGYQSFALDKSMVKKLFTKRLKRPRDYMTMTDDDDLTEPQKQIKDSILRRKGITIQTWDYRKQTCLIFLDFVFCCRCCGRKKSQKKPKGEVKDFT